MPRNAKVIMGGRKNHFFLSLQAVDGITTFICKFQTFSWILGRGAVSVRMGAHMVVKYTPMDFLNKIAALKCIVFFYIRFVKVSNASFNQILRFSTTSLKTEDISELISI